MTLLLSRIESDRIMLVGRYVLLSTPSLPVAYKHISAQYYIVFITFLQVKHIEIYKLDTGDIFQKVKIQRLFNDTPWTILFITIFSYEKHCISDHSETFFMNAGISGDVRDIVITSKGGGTVQLRFESDIESLRNFVNIHQHTIHKIYFS